MVLFTLLGGPTSCGVMPRRFGGTAPCRTHTGLLRRQQQQQQQQQRLPASRHGRMGYKPSGEDSEHPSRSRHGAQAGHEQRSTALAAAVAEKIAQSAAEAAPASRPATNGGQQGDRSTAARPTRLSARQLQQQVAAIILAGGPSDNPLARHCAMPAVPFGSNVRLIDVPINNCLSSGIGKIFVLTQYNSLMLNSYLTQAYPPIRFSGPGGHSFVNVTACNQTPDNKAWYRGSAEAVARNLPEFDLSASSSGAPVAEDYVILSGNAVYDVDFAAMVAQHRKSGADVTLATYGVGGEQARRMGVVRTHAASGRVTHFVEKPSAAALGSFATAQDCPWEERPFEASLGIYVFRADALRALLGPQAWGAGSGGGPGQPPAHFGHDVLPAAISGGLHVQAYSHAGQWADVHRLRDFFDASMQLAGADGPVAMQNMTALQVALPPAMLHSAELDNVLLGDGSVLRGCSLSDVVVGRRSFVDAGARLKSVVLVGNDVIQGESGRAEARAAGQPVLGVGRDCLLEDVIVDANACIGDGARLPAGSGRPREADRSEEEGFVIQDGLLVVLRGAAIPAGFALG